MALFGSICREIIKFIIVYLIIAMSFHLFNYYFINIDTDDIREELLDCGSFFDSYCVTSLTRIIQKYSWNTFKINMFKYISGLDYIDDRYVIYWHKKPKLTMLNIVVDTKYDIWESINLTNNTYLLTSPLIAATTYYHFDYFQLEMFKCLMDIDSLYMDLLIFNGTSKLIDKKLKLQIDNLIIYSGETIDFILKIVLDSSLVKRGFDHKFEYIEECYLVAWKKIYTVV